MPDHTHLPDRGGLATEQTNPRSKGLHRLSAGECVELITSEDRCAVDAAQAAAPAIAAFVQAAEPGFIAGGRLIYLGAGTSGRLGVLDASEAPPTFLVEPGRVIGIIAGGDAALRRSSEGLEDDADGARAELESLALTPNDAVIGIAAGGTTPYARGALDIARAIEPSVVTGFITCVEVDPPAGCQHLIHLPTGPELLTGSTRMKAGTATKLALNAISTTLMIRAGRVYDNLMVDLRATNAKLRDRAARILAQLTGLDRSACLALLGRAEGEVKTAVVMQRRGLELEAARDLLADAGGRLDLVIDANPPEAGP